MTDNTPTPGTGRLGRGPTSERFVTVAEVRSFLSSDFSRRLAVLLAGLLSLVVATAAIGSLDGIPDATGGLFAPDATPLSPASSAHLIWAPALILVVGYAVWVWLPWSRRSGRVEVTAYPATIAILLMTCWLATVEAGGIRTSAVLAVAVWAALFVTLGRSARVRSVGFLDRQATQLPFAVLLGWMTVMAATNLALVAKRWGLRPWQVPPETWWVLGVVAILAVAMVVVRYLPGRLFVAGGVAWGLVMIGYARLFGQPKAYAVAVVSLVCALLVLVAAVTVLLWLRTRRLY